MDTQLSEFVINAQNGDKKAFARLYELTLQSTYYFAIRMLENEQSAMDVVRDSFIEAFSSISRLKSPDVFEGYVKHVVAGKCRDYLKENREVSFDDVPNADAYDDSEFLPADFAVQKGAGRFISAVLDSLPCQQRMVTLLFFYNKLTIPAIAKFIGCTPEATAAYLADAKSSVKEAVQARIGVELGECEQQQEPVMTTLLMRAAKVQKINEELYKQAYKDIYEQLPQFLPDVAEQSERKSTVREDLEDDDEEDDDDYEEKRGLSSKAQVLIVVAVLVALVAAVWIYFFMTQDVSIKSLFSISADVPGGISRIASSL